MKNIIILSFILAGFNFANGQSSIDENQNAKKIQEVVSSYHEEGEFNGTILVAEEGNVIYSNAFGIANRKLEIPLTTKSPFYLCSLSKQFTSLAIMILEEQGKLSYDDKLSDYFPEFPEYAKNITIHNLLTHTSGIFDYFKKRQYRSDLTNDDVLKFLIKQTKTNFQSGTKFSYSNSGYVLLSLIIERVAKIPYHDFLKENIFVPLGMENTHVFDESKPKIPNRAIGYKSNGKLNDYEILTTGDGGIYSSVEDLFLWDQALYSNILVSEETLKNGYQSVKLANGEKKNYGYGWGLDPENEIVSHGGSLAGYRTYIKRDLKNRRTIIVLSNYSDVIGMKEIPKQISDILDN